MPGQYSTRCDSRPHPESSETQTAPPRRFLCVRYRAPVLVCSHCDRGPQAFAVFELIDELRDTIWRRYALQIQEEYRDQRRHDDADYDPIDPNDLPF
jgi:hypothetical protein